MQARPFTTGLFQCRLCKHALPIRHFHSSFVKNDDEANSPSRRAESRATITYRSLDDLARSAPRPARKFPGSYPNQTQTQTGGPQKVIYRRVGPQQHQPSPDSASRGQRGGRVRDRGLRAPRGRARRGQRGRKTDNDDDEAEELRDIDITHYEMLSEEHGDAFASIEEVRNYAQVLDLLESYDDYKERRQQLEEYRAAPKGYGSKSSETLQRMADDLKDEGERFDALIAEALQHVIDTNEKFLPRHEPPDTSAVVQPKGNIGNVPIGPSGMGNLVEEGLRQLSGRMSMGFHDARALAAKLANGDFVKFSDANEKNEVLRLAEELEWQDGQDVRQQNVGFEELDDDAKTTVVETLVRGYYKDPKDGQLNGNLIKGVARLAWGNGTYPSASKQMLLDTIAEMMPQEAGAPGPEQPDKQKG